MNDAANTVINQVTNIQDDIANDWIVQGFMNWINEEPGRQAGLLAYVGITALGAVVTGIGCAIGKCVKKCKNKGKEQEKSAQKIEVAAEQESVPETVENQIDEKMVSKIVKEAAEETAEKTAQKVVKLIKEDNAANQREVANLFKDLLKQPKKQQAQSAQKNQPAALQK